MATPRRRSTRARRDKRRTHQKLSSPALSVCPQCHEPKRPHHVCPNCGFYHGREVTEVTEI